MSGRGSDDSAQRRAGGGGLHTEGGIRGEIRKSTRANQLPLKFQSDPADDFVLVRYASAAVACDPHSGCLPALLLPWLLPVRTDRGLTRQAGRGLATNTKAEYGAPYLVFDVAPPMPSCRSTSAARASPWDFLRTGACAWWLIKLLLGHQTPC